MTLNELLALIGRAWSRLLLYPGGVAAFGGLWLMYAVTLRRWPRRALLPLLGHTPIMPVASAWLGVALLPLPGAVDLGHGIDAVAVLALLDLPLLATLAAELRAGDLQRTAGITRLAAALNGYPTLVLALLMLAWSSGSLELATLLQVPAQRDVLAALHWLGAVALLLALPPVLGIGAFAATPRPAMWLGLALRRVGHTAIAALPLAALGAGQLWQLLPLLMLGAALWWFHAATTPSSAVRWARGYLALDLALLLIMLAAAGFGLWQHGF